MKRDLLLDNLRALAMIHIICIIHVLYFFRLGNEYIRSLLLFEMPAIFFIAGASQSLATHPKTIIYTIKSKTKRILIPFYIFLAILYIWMIIFTFFPVYTGVEIDITRLSANNILKTLCTGGCNCIPFYGYTWFISVYLIISISLPLQRKVLDHINKYVYISIWIAMVVALSFVTFPVANLEIKNLVVYNVFYLTGFCCYRQTGMKSTAVVAFMTVAITFYGFLSGIMIPMQNHKFPADYLFLIFGLAWLSTMALILNSIKQKRYGLLDTWNKNGYYLYLYQTITFSTIVWITHRWIGMVDSDIVKFSIYFALCMAINTLLAYIIKWTKSLFKH